MALTDEEIEYARVRLGTSTDISLIEDTYERVGTVDGAILEILRSRLSDLLNEPATFAIPGEYSQSTAENIKALQARIAEVEGGIASAGAVRVVPAPAPRLR